MNNWKSVTIGQISILKYGENLPSPELTSEGYPVFGANGHIGYYSRFNLETPTVLVSCRGEYSRTINLAPAFSFVTNNSIPVLVKNSVITNRFLYYFLQTIPASRIVSGSAQPQVVIKDLHSVEIKYPQIETQRRIAEILSTVDEAIEQTEALIVKYQQIKAGLMHDLFTHGVTPNGKLRPPRSEAPQLYKKSPLGWIPKEWDYQTLDDLLAKTACPMRSGPFGSALLKDELTEEGIPLLGIDNVLSERFIPKYRRFVTPSASLWN